MAISIAGSHEKVDMVSIPKRVPDVGRMFHDFMEPALLRNFLPCFGETKD